MTATAGLKAKTRCPICGGTIFGPGPKGRASPNGAMPRCAGCQSLERHRIFRIMFDKLGPEGFSGWKAIQFSPDPTVDPQWFASHDLSVYGEPGGLDIQAIDRPDMAYDIVICSHVLEHVGDDRAALHELLRIAKPDGLLYLAFPTRSARRSRAIGDFRNRKNMATGASTALTWRIASPPISPTSRCLPTAGRTRSQANGKARSCCRVRRSAIAGSSKSSGVRSACFPDLRFSRPSRRPKSATRAAA